MPAQEKSPGKIFDGVLCIFTRAKLEPAKVSSHANRIDVVQENGVSIDDPSQIQDTATRYFSNLYKSPPASLEDSIFNISGPQLSDD